MARPRTGLAREAGSRPARPDAPGRSPLTRRAFRLHFATTARPGPCTSERASTRPSPPEVYGFEVSGLKVVQSWLRYRMRNGAGRTSSPLDAIRPKRWTSRFTTELLELLWVLEATVEAWPEQERLLEAVVEGECLRADELPPVPEEMRKPPPKARRSDPPALDLDDRSA